VCVWECVRASMCVGESEGVSRTPLVRKIAFANVKLKATYVRTHSKGDKCAEKASFSLSLSHTHTHTHTYTLSIVRTQVYSIQKAPGRLSYAHLSKRYKNENPNSYTFVVVM